jgi:hypothetical protein
MLGTHLTEYLQVEHQPFKIDEQNPSDNTQSKDEFARMHVSKKIELLENFCTINNTEKENTEKLLHTLREINDIRNSIAHWGLQYNDKTKEFTLVNRKNPERIMKEIKKSVDAMHEKYSAIIHCFGHLSNELLAKRKKKNTPDKHHKKKSAR